MPESKRKPKLSEADGAGFIPTTEIDHDDRAALRLNLKELVNESAFTVDDGDFFLLLETSVDEFIYHFEMVKEYPTRSQSNELMKQIFNHSRSLSILLKKLDFVTEELLSYQGHDLKHLERELRLIAEFIENENFDHKIIEKPSWIEQHPFVAFAKNVLFAVHSYGLDKHLMSGVTTIKLIEVIMKQLLELESVKKLLKHMIGEVNAEDFAQNRYLKDHIREAISS